MPQQSPMALALEKHVITKFDWLVKLDNYYNFLISYKMWTFQEPTMHVAFVMDDVWRRRNDVIDERKTALSELRDNRPYGLAIRTLRCQTLVSVVLVYRIRFERNRAKWSVNNKLLLVVSSAVECLFSKSFSYHKRLVLPQKNEIACILTFICTTKSFITPIIYSILKTRCYCICIMIVLRDSCTKVFIGI